MAKAVFSSFRERFCRVAECALAMNRNQEKAELLQNLSLEELFCALPAKACGKWLS